jgi:glycine cleavage system regulatory protein
MGGNPNEIQHAALWLIGPDMPGLLRMGAKYVAERGGNIDKDIADKFGEKAVVFMSITAQPADIVRMDKDKEQLKKASGCGVVFQPMKDPTVPPGFRPDLYGFDIVTDDASGLVAELTGVVEQFGMLLVGHTAERRSIPGPRPVMQAGQKFIVMLPFEFDHLAFTRALDEVVRRFRGTIKTPLRTVPGLLWWW